MEACITSHCRRDVCMRPLDMDINATPLKLQDKTQHKLPHVHISGKRRWHVQHKHISYTEDIIVDNKASQRRAKCRPARSHETRPNFARAEQHPPPYACIPSSWLHVGSVPLTLSPPPPQRAAAATKRGPMTNRLSCHTAAYTGA